jgi:DNA repair protein SbcC/Rad50
VKLIHVRLINIKSYTDETVQFSEGVTFVSGPNGAGKSTIFESVGYGLFDWAPTRDHLQYFLRRGQKNGSITIRFIANDEREYEVLRQIGTRREWTITDVEAGEPLDTQGARDMQDALRELMGIDPDWETKDIFGQVVSVEQGKFTTSFLLSDRLRRDEFDAIFKVKVYREAFTKSNRGRNVLDERIQTLDIEISRIEGQLEPWDETVAELERRESDKTRFDSELAEQKSNESTAKVVVAAARDRRTRFLGLREREQALAHIAESIRENLDRATSSLDEAHDAAKTLETLSTDEERYQQVRGRTAELAGQLADKATVDRQLSTLERDISTLEGALKTASTQSVAERTELESRSRDISNLIEEVSGAFVTARAVETTTREELTTRQAHRTSLEPVFAWISSLDTVESGVTREAADATSDADELKRLDAVADEARDLEPLAGELTARESALRDLRERVAALQDRRTGIEEQRTIATGKMCPFFEKECPIIDDAVDEGEFGPFFDRKLCPITEEIETARAAIPDAETAIAKARTARDRVAELRVMLKSREGISERLSRRRDNARGFIVQWRDSMPVIVSGVVESGEQPPPFAFTEKKETPSDQMSIWDQATTETGGWDELTASFTTHATQWRTWRDALDTAITVSIDEARTKLQSAQSDFTRETERQKNAQAQQNDLTVRTRRLEERVAEIEADRARLTHMQAQTKGVRAEAERLAGLDNERQSLASELSTLEEPHTRYIRAQSQASRAESLEKERTDLTQRGEACDHDLEAVHTDLREFDDEDTATRLDETQKVLSSAQAKVDVTETELRNIAAIIDRLTARKTVLEGLRKDLDTKHDRLALVQRATTIYGSLRGVLKEAAEPVAKEYRASISRDANRIYQRIARDSSELIWGRDYEIDLLSTIDGQQQTRSFRQLSGGEQMSSALAIRLALMRQSSSSGLGMFDEPTANLDEERRRNLAQALPDVAGEGFQQLIVISHDDTFDALSEHVIRLEKDPTGTRAT